MELKQTLELQGEYGISDEDMYEWLLNMDPRLAKQFKDHTIAYQRVLDSVEAIQERFRPGFKPHYEPETSEQVRHRADSTRTLVQQLDRQGNLKATVRKEWLDR